MKKWYVASTARATFAFAIEGDHVVECAPIGRRWLLGRTKDEARAALRARSCTVAELEDEPDEALTAEDGAGMATGKYHREAIANETERESGMAVAKDNVGPLKFDSKGHKVLLVYRNGERMTAYHAAMLAFGGYHTGRRESRRLFERGFLRKDGHMANPDIDGRASVDAYVITQEGLQDLERLAA